ncbi:MAG: P-II family nitrogen regulator [Nitrospirae bacterium]|nr:P-II family nitrogen regulator [Candidatus Troglogloeales bacterium]MBI3598256.1 P-II family nitrogen regulator [Candidatus Troglogloeales bacterium]
MTKMIQAIIRPEKEDEVVAALEKEGIYPFTRQAVLGRGRQRGIEVGNVRYEELSKVWLMLVVEEKELDCAVEAIKIAACTGNPGDGKIFVATLAESRTIHHD